MMTDCKITSTSTDNNDIADHLGITLPLSAEFAERLRHYQPPPPTQKTAAPQSQSTKHQPQPKLSLLSKRCDIVQHTDDGASCSDLEENAPLLVGDDPLDDWNDVLLLPEGGGPTKDGEADNNLAADAHDDQKDATTTTSADKKDEIDNKNCDDDGDLSVSPPPHMPVVVVDLKRLVGYLPSSDEEVQELNHQIHTALWYGSSPASAQAAAAADTHKSSRGGGGNPQEDDDTTNTTTNTTTCLQQVLDAAQHFDERVTELMESGVAAHSTTEEEATTTSITTTPASSSVQHQQQQQQSRVVVTYPEFLCTPKVGDDDQTNANTDDTKFAPRQVLATAQIWKGLLRPHPIPVVANLLQLLRQCNRSLVWKYAMHQELWELAKSEERSRIRRHQALALREWKATAGRRDQQLEQLYQVRETLELRFKMAKSKVRELEVVRDQMVAQEMLRRRWDAQGGGGGAGGMVEFDLNSTILAFPDANEWLGLEDDDDGDNYHDDQVGPSFVSDDDDSYGGGGESDASGYDAEGDIDEHDGDTAAVVASDNNNDPRSPTTIQASSSSSLLPKRDTKARREALAKRRRRRLEEAAKEAEHQSKLDRARAEEERMREMCTTNDLKMSQAIAAALEKKMESVDELLEGLQEEAWADEEARENGEVLMPGDDDDYDDEEEEDNSMNGDTSDLTLLDQVLAMILGTFPPPSPSDGEDPANVLARHIQKLHAEHSRIVKEWKAYFGRLPSLPLSPKEQQQQQHQSQRDGKNQSELRSCYGIVENEDDDWDNSDSDDDGKAVEKGKSDDKKMISTSKIIPREEQQQQQTNDGVLTKGDSTPSPARPRVGLRPGGKVVRDN